MRRILSVIMVMLCLTSAAFSGCSPSDKSLEAEKTEAALLPSAEKVTTLVPDPDASGTLTIDFMFDIYDGAAQRAKALYQKLYPNVDVIIADHAASNLDELDVPERITWIVQSLKVFQTEIMAGRGPDVFIAPADVMDMPKAITAGACADLTPYFEKDPNFNIADFNETIFASGQYQGKQYMVPLDYFFPMILTTEEILDEIGFDQAQCTDYFSTGDELVRVLSAYKERTPDFHPETAFNRFDIPYQWPYTSGIVQLDYAQELVQLPKEDVQHIYTQMEKLSPYFFIQQNSLQNSGTVPVFQQLLDRDMLFSQFQQTTRNDFRRVIPPLIGAGETPVLLPYRNVNGGITASSAKYVAVNQNCKNKENAYRFVKLLLSPEFILAPKGISEGNWYSLDIPVSKDALASLIETWQTPPNAGTPQEGWTFINGTPYPAGPLSESFINQFLKYINEIDQVCLETPAHAFVRDDMLPCLYGDSGFEQCYQNVLGKLEIYISE